MSQDFNKLEEEADAELASLYGVQDANLEATESASSQDSADNTIDTDTEEAAETAVNQEDVEEVAENTVPERQYKDAVRGMNKAMQEAAALRKEMAAMQADIQAQREQLDSMQQRKADEPEKADIEDMSQGEFARDFPELYEGIVNPLLKQIDTLNKKIAGITNDVSTAKGFAEQYQRDAQLSAQDRLMADVRSAHADVDDLLQSENFWNWVREQPPEIQAMTQSTNARSAAKVLTLYKTENDLAPSKADRSAQGRDKLAEAKAAASPTVRGSQSPEQKKSFTLAEIEKMSRAEFLKHEAAIDEAIAKGELY